MAINNCKTSIIILAAGKGTRMKSNTPKCLNKIANCEMLKLIINESQKISPENISVIISEEMKPQISSLFSEKNINIIIQKDRLGTGHAVKIAFENLKKLNLLSEKSLILYGDCPNINHKTLKKLTEKSDAISVLGFNCLKENDYGRLIAEDNNNLKYIVEVKDANEDQKKVTLCNSGIMSLQSNKAENFLKQINNNNKSKEYYLTDLVKIAKNNGEKCSFIITDEKEVFGVNSKKELAAAQKIIQQKLCEKLMDEGVTIIDPSTTYLSYDTKIKKGSTIYPNVFFGLNVEIEENVEIKSFSHIEGAKISSNCSIGPFARIRPNTKLSENVKIGNFVEIKNSNLSQDVKAGHLSYIGDANIGSKSNIGAGAITCNYDGKNKYKTNIDQNVFIGSNTSLIAPISVEKNSMIAAGSVVNKDISANELAISRSKQKNIKDGAKKFKK